MGLEALKKISVKSYQLEKVQGHVADVLRNLEGNELVTGKFVDVTLLAGSSNLVNHNLGRQARWIICRKKGNASDIWELSGNAPKSQLILDCSVDVSVTLYLF